MDEMLIHPYNKTKLSFRSKECVFFGYSSMHKGYKCLDTKSGRVYISQDVIFDENIFPFSNIPPNSPSPETSSSMHNIFALQWPSSKVNLTNDHVHFCSC
jgi:hypothetical protein